ncbi:hypothetical protein AAMO2058_000475400, partial [Amorphochlora amoebiformis]
SEDIPLFIGITKDLFPKIVTQSVNYRLLISKITQVCKDHNLQVHIRLIRIVM